MPNWLWLAIGFIVGGVIARIISNAQTPIIGFWHVSDDPEKDVFRIEFTKDPEVVFHRKWIAFEIREEKDS